MKWGTTDPQNVETFRAEEVYRAELDEIANRRRAAHKVGRLGVEEVKDDLVGVALSGGGVRSGALGLGFLQGLYEKKLLPFVDYLSTVSGGGYAGAYLSSVSLASHEYGGREKSDSDQREGQVEQRCERVFPISSEVNGKQPLRMRKFMFGSRYLKRTWTFANRYLFGLLLTWLVILSGLAAICAFAAWAFRWIDSPWVCSWLNAVGIYSDFARAFVPAIVMSLLWYVTWVISYWRNGARATGAVPRFFCRAMVIAFALGFAALIGTGDVTLPAFLQADDAERTEANSWTGVRMLVLSAIVASLLPYFTISRLLRSGANPRNTGEKYIFYIATNALVYGVPFAVFAYFARENISNWNERRSDRITQAELRTTNPQHPLWRELVMRADGADADPSAASFWAQPASPMISYVDDMESLRRTKRVLLTHQTLSAMARELNQPEEDDKSQLATSDKGDSSASSDPLDAETATWEMDDEEKPPSPWGYLAAHSQQASPPKDRELSRPYRWFLLLKYGFQRVFESPEEYGQNRISRLARNRRELTEVKWELAHAVNAQLADKSLYQRLVPIKASVDAESTGPGPASSDADETERDVAGLVAGLKSFDRDGTTLLGDYRRIVAWLPGAKDSISQAEAEQVFTEWRTNVLRARMVAESVARQEPFSRPLEPMSNLAPAAEPEIRKLQGDTYQKLVGEDFDESLALEEETWQRNMIAANRDLMSAYYGLGTVCPKEIVFAANVLYEDQQTRMRWFLVALVVFVLSSLLGDLNFTSWHGFYSEQIGQFWIDDVPGLGKRLPLAQLETASFGRPYHLLTGCMNRLGIGGPDETGDPQTPFLFSKLFCGASPTGYEATETWMGGQYTLEDAVAVSGAAVSPVRANNPLMMALLLLFNIRLGQWVDAPGKRTRFRWFVSPMHVMLTLLQKYEARKMQFITDGGHVENLGIEPLLKRRCRLIVAVDAGQDEKYAFSDFGRLIRRMRLNHGITFLSPGDPEKPLSMIQMQPTEKSKEEGTNFVTSNLLLAEIRYPESDGSNPSYMIYMKSCLTGREPLELIQVAERTEFPHDPTSDQFLAPEQFEAYRLLGHFLSSTLAGRIPAQVREDAGQMTQQDFVDRLVGREPSREARQPPSDEVRRIMEVVKDEHADSFERRNAARDLINQEPFPADVLSDLVDVLCRDRDQEVADGVADAVASAGSDAINPLLAKLPADPTGPEFREILRISNVLEQIQQDSDQPLQDVGGVVADLLRRSVESLSRKQKPTKVSIGACCKMIEVLRIIMRLQPSDDPLTVKIESILKKVAKTPHDEIRRAAEFTLGPQTRV